MGSKADGVLSTIGILPLVLVSLHTRGVSSRTRPMVIAFQLMGGKIEPLDAGSLGLRGND